MSVTSYKSFINVTLVILLINLFCISVVLSKNCPPSAQCHRSSKEQRKPLIECKGCRYGDEFLELASRQAEENKRRQYREYYNEQEEDEELVLNKIENKEDICCCPTIQVIPPQDIGAPGNVEFYFQLMKLFAEHVKDKFTPKCSGECQSPKCIAKKVQLTEDGRGFRLVPVDYNNTITELES